MLHLLLDFFVGRPLVEGPQMDALQRLLTHHLPTWTKGLAVARDEHDERRLVRPGESLVDVIREMAPARFGLANAVLLGSYDGLSLFVQSSQSTLPPESNVLSLEIVDRGDVEGQPPQTWAAAFFRQLPAVLSTRYARAHLSEEFESKNLDRTGGGVRAVGVQLARALPGLYWLNYLGAPYTNLVGLERLLSVPAPEARQIAEGVLIGLDDDPTSWQSSSYRDRERRTMEHLGKELFFDRSQPERPTVAPSLRETRPRGADSTH